MQLRRPTGQMWTHQWGHFTGDPRTGDLYFQRLESGAANPRIHKWTYERWPGAFSDPSGNDSWPLAITGNATVYSNRSRLEFFPDLNNGEGGLAIIDGGGGGAVVYSSSDFTNWTRNGGNGLNTAEYELVSCYLPQQQTILYGGGKYFDTSSHSSRDLAKVDANGVSTTLNDTPFQLGTGGDTGFMVAFPNGRVFGIDVGGELLYESSDGGSSWSTSGLTALPFDGYWTAGCAIPEWGVIYVVSQQGSGGGDPVQEWIYKL